MSKKSESRAAKPAAPEPELPAAISIPLEEAVIIHNAINVAVKRGAYEANEIANVGKGFDALTAEFQKLAPPAPQPEKADEAQAETQGN